MKKRRAIGILVATGMAVVCATVAALLLWPQSTPQTSQTTQTTTKSQSRPHSSGGSLTERPAETEKLPLLTETEAGITVYNAYAANITKSSATVKITLTRTFVGSYTLLLGDSPDTLSEVGSETVGEARSSISYTLTDLSEHTRYYFAFRIRTDSALIQTDVTSFVTPDDYYDGSGGGSVEDARYGIDVSYWNETIDFTRLAEQDIDFVIIRIGSSKGKDDYFEEHYEQAKAAGLKVGGYYYTYATTLSEIEQDADDCLDYIGDKTFDFPVYMDIENDAQKSLPRRLLTEIAITFCERIADAGHYPGVYASRNWYLLRFNSEMLSAVYELWVAAWTTDGQPDGDYSSGFGMWQYSDKGKIDGVPGYADLNVCYKDYPAIIRR